LDSFEDFVSQSITLNAPCPQCGEEGETELAQRFVSGRLSFSRSFACSRCGFARESDSPEAKGVREQLLRSESYTLLLQDHDVVAVAAAIREANVTSLDEARRQAVSILDGSWVATRAEAAQLLEAFERRGVAGEIARLS
jgi:predicted RNA-binding Zn-ribbon protein involved in translation (DUF1610 family)